MSWEVVAYCIYKVVDAMSIDLCGISGDVQY